MLNLSYQTTQISVLPVQQPNFQLQGQMISIHIRHHLRHHIKGGGGGEASMATAVHSGPVAIQPVCHVPAVVT